MKKALFTVFALVLAVISFAQTKGDNLLGNSIIGDYESIKGKDHFKVHITQNRDGSFKGQIFWMEIDKDENGKVLLDEKNPDKSLRKLPCTQIVLFDGLTYNAKKKVWDGTKIYDPQRGIRANVTCEFQPDGKLMLKGSVLGISEKAYWTKIK